MSIPSASHAVALVAEDEPLIRMEVVDTLTDAGLVVLEAGNADAALAHLERQPSIVLLFTDIRMPGPMDGIALAHQVARRWPSTDIIVCSSRVTPEAGILPAKARFIDKPFTSSLIIGVLREFGLVDSPAG